jgi:hypothetical protein
MTPVCVKRLSKGCFAGSPRRNPSSSTLRRPRSRPRIGSPLRLRQIDRWGYPRGSRRHRSSHGAPSHAPIGMSANRLPRWERQRLRQRRSPETLPPNFGSRNRDCSHRPNSVPAHIYGKRSASHSASPLRRLSRRSWPIATNRSPQDNASPVPATQTRRQFASSLSQFVQPPTTAVTSSGAASRPPLDHPSVESFGPAASRSFPSFGGVSF